MSWLVDIETWLTNRVPDPILFAFITGLLFSTWLVPDLWPVAKRHLGIGAKPMPDMNISDAIDYIVNDSVATLKRSRPSWTENWPGGGTVTLSEMDVEHVDALTQLNERARIGEITIWGRKEIFPAFGSNRFEGTIRKIGTDYWQIANLAFSMCLHRTKAYPQTMIPGYPISDRSFARTTSHYTGLMVNRNEVLALWPSKPVWRRLWDANVLKKPRITSGRAPDVRR